MIQHLEPELRELLRRAIDARRRQLVADEWWRDGCAGCGGELSGVTAGCAQCSDRARRRWRRRHEPGYTARETAASNARRKRRSVAA